MIQQGSDIDILHVQSVCFFLVFFFIGFRFPVLQTVTIFRDQTDQTGSRVCRQILCVFFAFSPKAYMFEEKSERHLNQKV